MSRAERVLRPARAVGGASGHRRSPLSAVPVAVASALVVLATGCQTPIEGADGHTEPVTLVVSETWVQSQQGGGASAGEARARIASLRRAIDQLRAATRTGWTGRQDEVTGFLGDLSGGAWPGSPMAFLDEYGPALFGVDAATLRFEDPDTDTVPHVTSTRVTQALGDVPVLDASLVVSGRGGSASTDDLRVTGVRGRVFPGLTVATTPTLSAEQGAAAAVRAAGGTSDGPARLVVLPTGPGVLAWEVVVVAEGAGIGSAGRYYVDARTGDLLDVRPVAAGMVPPTAGPAARRAEPDPDSVQLSGQDSLGRDRTGYGLQTPTGVELTDTTTEAWDPATRSGAVQTYDASEVRSQGQLPGRLVTSPGTTVSDADAIAAQSFSHTILAYYQSLGRDSWDDRGGPLVSSVHFGEASYCNAMFAGYLRQPQMVYGNPCVYRGEQLTGSFVEPDIAAHEITHGVTQTSAGLLYSGQSGALNESFSDYFGNIVGDLIHGSDSAALGEDSCTGVTSSALCLENPDGTTSFRYLLNGTDYDDYLRILNPGERLQLLIGYTQDYGGVHYNSAIWNNALWSIRTRLARIDGAEGRTSRLAHDFDRAVYGALATRLTPTSGFVDARAGVEQVILDSRLDPVVLRTAREVFDQLKICPGCPSASELAGDSVTTASQTQLHPSISGDRVLWLDLSAGSTYLGHAATTTLGDDGAPSLSAASDALEVTFAGDAVLALDLRGRVTRTDASGTTTLERVDLDATLAAGLGGSDTGAAWLSRGGTVKYVDAGGTVTATGVSGLGGDTITTVAAGGGTVVVGTEQGKVFAWTPGRGEARQVGQLPDAILSAAAYAGSVFVIDERHRSVLITADGQTLDVTDNAAPFGAAMSSSYVVWAEATSPIRSEVVPGGTSPYPDTDLYLLSVSTGKIYDLHDVPAQQGFPSISGDRLVWQDATYGGDDVFTARLPGGL